MLAGKLSDLRQQDAIIVNDVGAQTRLAKPSKIQGGRSEPLKSGIPWKSMITGPWWWASAVFPVPFNPSRWSIRPTAGRPPLPPGSGKLLSFVLVKAKAGQDPQTLTRRIREQTGLAAYTAQEFKDLTYNYFMKNTGIPINFGIAVALGFIIGTAIAGQTFYNFTLENMRYFGTLKAMGATNGVLLRMILLQALLVGALGYGLGVGRRPCSDMVLGEQNFLFA